MTEATMTTTDMVAGVVPTVTVPAFQLREALASALVATGTDKTVPVLRGVLMTWTDGGTVEYAATDRYRLVMVETDTAGAGDGRVLLARDAVTELVKALPKPGKYVRDNGSPVVVTVTGSHVTFRFDDGVAAWSREYRMLDGDFPKCRPLVPGIVGGSDRQVTAVESIGWNPILMADFAKLPMVGNGTAGMHWTFYGSDKPLVSTIDGQCGTRVIALLMPVRRA